MMKIPICRYGIALGVLMMCTQVWAQNKVIFGRIEKVRVYPGGLLLHAKLDSGADHSSLNAPDLAVFERQGERWIRFRLTDEHGKSLVMERKVQRMAKIKRNGLPSQSRYVVRLGICLGDIYKEVDVNLVDRSRYKYPILIGRSFMAGNVLIDPAVKYTAAPHCKDRSTP